MCKYKLVGTRQDFRTFIWILSSYARLIPDKIDERKIISPCQAAILPLQIFVCKYVYISVSMS